MGLIKEASEDASIAFERARTLAAWASVSFIRVMLVVSLLGVSLLIAQFAYLNYLIGIAQKNTDSRLQELNILSKEHIYKGALDAITLCLDSKKEKPKLRTWYCEQAVYRYKDAARDRPQERVNEVISRLAYAAMKNDVSHYLRALELERLRATSSKEEEILQLLLSKTVRGLWVFFVIAVMLGAYLILWILPTHKKSKTKQAN